MSIRKAALSSACAVMALSTAAMGEGSLTIATENTCDMILLHCYTYKINEAPRIDVEWVTLEENVLRQRVTTDITTKGGQFDIMTIGMYETPIWGANDWLVALDDLSEEYDVDDILPAMAGGLSHDGTLYAAPFYGESSMVMYRKDLTDAAGVTIGDNDSWENIRAAAEAIHNPDEVYGACLRGKPGWGDNMAFITTMLNSFGGAWFDADFRPQLDSPEWNAAINFFVLGAVGC